jgi:hypothetical protein
MRGFYNVLNINNLRLGDILSLCNMHHFGLRNSPFQGAIWCISAPEMGFIIPRNGHYRKEKWIVQDYDIGYMKR